jgi:hypothetical protein
MAYSPGPDGPTDGLELAEKSPNRAREIVSSRRSTRRERSHEDATRSARTGLLIGVAVGIPAILLAWISLALGSDDMLARVLFPGPMLSMDDRDSGLVPITAGLLQFPLYGGLMGYVTGGDSRFFPKSILLAPAAHVALVVACFMSA